MPAAAIIGSALIGGGLSYLGSKSQSDAAGKAAQTQANAANDAAQVQWNMFQTNRADMAPWMDSGKQSLNYLSSLMQPGRALTQTFDSSKFVQDPGYDFRLNQGSDAIKKLSASRGQFFSGNMGKALDEYNQNFASNEYANAYGRYMNNQNALYNRLAGLANTGQTAARTVGTLGANAANAVGSNMIAAGNDTANGYLNSADATASGYSGMADAVGGGVRNYLYYGLNQKPGSIGLWG